VELGEIESDKGGEDAEAHAAKGQSGAVGSDAPEDMREREMTRRGGRDARDAKGESDTSDGKENREQSDGGQSPTLEKEDAEGRSDGESPEGGDAVPGDDFGDVLGTGAPDAPNGGSRADHAFTDAEEEAAEEDERKGDGGRRSEKGSEEIAEAAGGAGEEAVDDDGLGAEVVDQTAGAGAGEDRGHVLRADDESGEDGAVAELQVGVGRKNGEGNADGEVADERKRDGGKDFEGGGEGRVGGGFGGERGRVGHGKLEVQL